MDPVRRLFLLALFVSVVATEPSQVRAMAGEQRVATPGQTTKLIQRLAVVFRRAVQVAEQPPARRRFGFVHATPGPAPQVIHPHAPIQPLDCRLPPPNLG